MATDRCSGPRIVNLVAGVALIRFFLLDSFFGATHNPRVKHLREIAEVLSPILSRTAEHDAAAAERIEQGRSFRERAHGTARRRMK